MLTHDKQKGFGLIELMVSMVIGVLLMLGMVTFLLNNLKSNRDVILATRLDQELRSTMTLLSRDVRRAGYWGNTIAASGNPFQTVTTSTPGCILFSYDYGDTGSLTVPNNERYGYLLSGGAVWMRNATSSTVNTCTPGPSNVWDALTDNTMSTITALSFTPNTLSGTLTIRLVGQLSGDSNVKQTLVETIKLENGSITFN
jgi:prepilin-type N-terminal cleavage/methylation domain-containing protein